MLCGYMYNISGCAYLDSYVVSRKLEYFVFSFEAQNLITVMRSLHTASITLYLSTASELFWTGLSVQFQMQIMVFETL